MGIRSAFNPLGALPYSSGYVVTWTIDNIPKIGNTYVLPEAWSVDGVTVSTSALEMGTVSNDEENSGCYVVPFSYTVESGADPGNHTVTVNDSNFDDLND